MWLYGIGILIILACCSFKSGQFYVKLIGFYCILFIVPSICLPFALIKWRSADNISCLSWIGRKIVNKLYGIKWTIRGKNKLKRAASGVIISNHQCFLDSLALVNLYPYLAPMVPVIKKQLLYSGPFGFYAYLCESIFIDRSNTEAAKKELNQKIFEAKTKNWKIWIFPEGTRNPDGNLLPFKKGAFHMAIDAQLPIIPIVFHSFKPVYDYESKTFKSGTIEIDILDSVSTYQLNKRDVNNLCNSVHQTMLKYLKPNEIESEKEIKPRTKEMLKLKRSIELKNGASI